MKAVEEVTRKYYKYIYPTWEQPVLSYFTNGTFSVFSGSYMSGGEPYKCFTENTNDGCYNDNISVSVFWYKIFNAVPLNITNWQFYFTTNPTGNNSMDCPTAGIVYACNDDINYEQIGTWSVNSTNNQYKTIDLSDNQNYYRYYKLQPTAYSDNDPMFGHMIITATQQDAQESTISDYDFYKDESAYKVVKQNNTYKAFKSYEKGQYYGSDQ